MKAHTIQAWLLPLLLRISAPRILPVHADESNDPNQWYTKHAVYPPYCGTQDQMKLRRIPPLPLNISSAGQTKLVHVTTVLHHGARTILGKATNGPCWEGFWESEETGVWNCELNTYLAPPAKARIEQEEDGTDTNSKADPIFLFNLVFDALKKPLSNTLNGTCQEGQLLLRGYEQMTANGRFLRDRYLYDDASKDSEETEHDERMQLFSLKTNAEHNNPWEEHFVHVRSGDTQRTLMSGQILMKGLFGNELEISRDRPLYGFAAFPRIKVHTADHTMDILGGFQKNCPRLDAMRRESYTAKEYEEFYNSIESQQVRAFMEDQLSHDHGLFDCLMTTVCTDRPLPADVGEYDDYKSNWFSRIETYHTKNHSFPLQYNDAEYSKLSIGPLWAEILDHIDPIVLNDDSEMKHGGCKLAIYSGYDTTIMQLLSSLGENVWDGLVWPPYASMVLIELHELFDSDRDKTLFETNFAFRLIYNGRVLTSFVDGCSEDNELCDAKYLLDRVRPIAVRNVDCEDRTIKKVDPMQVAKSIVSETEGILLVLLVVGIGVFVGGLAVYWKFTGHVPDKVKNKIPEKIKEKAKKLTKKKKAGHDELPMMDADAPRYSDDHHEAIVDLN